MWCKAGVPLQPSPLRTNYRKYLLQFQKKPDIIGFTVGGEKIASMHYADNAILPLSKISVLKIYPLSSAPVEQRSTTKKTKCLWGGAWKNCTDTPLNI